MDGCVTGGGTGRKKPKQARFSFSFSFRSSSRDVTHTDGDGRHEIVSIYTPRVSHPTSRAVRTEQERLTARKEKARMGSRYEVEVTVASARDLKNVNWRNADLKSYAVLWVDGGAKCSTRVDLDNAENPVWDEKLIVPLPPSSRVEDAVLYIDVVHANAADGVKPLVGSARLPLRDVLDDAGIGGRASRSLRLKRPSGRPQGRLEVRVAVREAARYYDPSPYPAPYGQSAGSRDPYAAPPAYGSGSGGYAAPPTGYPAAYGAAPPPQPAYGAAAAAPPAAYGSVVEDPKKKSKMGMGTGLAVGAAAGVLGGLALAGGASYVENKIEDGVAEKVEEDSYGGGGFDDDY